jgi:hypothetical protein
MSVNVAILPKNSLLNDFIAKGDFVDCYACASPLDVDAVAAIAMSFPGWANFLLALRNIVVAPLGLKNSGPMGDAVGHFPLLKRNDQEVILGYDDSHLDFRIAVLKQNGMAYCATWVRTNNLLGKLYLKAIMPFHVLIVGSAMQRVSTQSRSGTISGEEQHS